VERTANDFWRHSCFHSTNCRLIPIKTAGQVTAPDPAIAAPLRPGPPQARPADRDQVQRDRGDRDPLPRSYGPWGTGAHVSYPYDRLVNYGLWHLPARAQLLDAKGNVREGVARERDAPAGFTADVLATFEREPELIDAVALHLLERHFAPGLHEEILEAVGLKLGTPVATRRRDMAFRAAVLEAYLAECCVCGFSLRLVDGLIGVDAAHIRWHAHGGPDEVPNGLALLRKALRAQEWAIRSYWRTLERPLPASWEAQRDQLGWQ
jgi:hypothetical protein